MIFLNCITKHMDMLALRMPLIVTTSMPKPGCPLPAIIMEDVVSIGEFNGLDEEPTRESVAIGLSFLKFLKSPSYSKEGKELNKDVINIFLAKWSYLHALPHFLDHVQ